DVRLHRASADLLRERLGLVLARAVADHDGSAGGGELLRDRTADPSRRSRDKRRLSFQGGEAHDSASDSCNFSSWARLLTEIAFAPLSMRFTRPESTLPGPTSTKVFTPFCMSSRAACVKRTGAVS